MPLVLKNSLPERRYQLTKIHLEIKMKEMVKYI